MGRIRTVKPEFFLHEELFDLEQETDLPLRIAYVGLWTQCDREGRFKWNPRRLKIQILPYDDLDFSRVLDALMTRGFLVKYENSGEEYGWIPSFKEHQFINNKEKGSRLPDPEKSNIINGLTRDLHEGNASTSRGVKEGKGREGNNNKKDMSDKSDFASIDEWYESFWKDYNYGHKAKGKEQLKKLKPTDELLEKIEAYFYEYRERQGILESLEMFCEQLPHIQRFFRDELWKYKPLPEIPQEALNGNAENDELLRDLKAIDEGVKPEQQIPDEGKGIPVKELPGNKSSG